MKSFRPQGRGKSSIAKVSAPLPVNLPSRRQEKAGHDISLVSSGSSWASPSLVSAAVVGSSASATSSPSTDGTSPILSSSGVVATHAGGATATNNNNGTSHNHSSDSPQLDSLGSSPYQKSAPRVWGIVAPSSDQNLEEFPTAAEAAKKLQEHHHPHDGHHTNGQSGGTSMNAKRSNVAGSTSGEAMAKTVSALSSDNKWDEVDDEGVDFLNADKIEFADGSVIVAAAVAQSGPVEHKTERENPWKQLNTDHQEERVVDRGEVDFNRAWPSRGSPSTGPGPSSRHPLSSEPPTRYPPQERAHHTLWQDAPSHRESDRRPSVERGQQGYYSGNRRESFSSKEHYPGPSRRDSLGAKDPYSGPRRDFSGPRDPHYDRRDSFEYRDRNYGRPRNFSRDREFGRDGDFNSDRRPSHDRPPYSSDRYPDRQQRDFQLLTRQKDSLPDHQGPHDSPGPLTHPAGAHYPPGDGRPLSEVGHEPGHSRQLEHRGPDLSQFAPPGAVEFDRPEHVTKEQRGAMKHGAEEARKRREEEERKFEEARARARARADALAKLAEEEKLAKAKAEEAAKAEQLAKENAEKAEKEKELQAIVTIQSSSTEAKSEDAEKKDVNSGWGELPDKAMQDTKESGRQKSDEDSWKSPTSSSSSSANAAPGVGPWRRTGAWATSRQPSSAGAPESSVNKDDKPSDNLKPVTQESFSDVVQRNQGLQSATGPSTTDVEAATKKQTGSLEVTTATSERNGEKASQTTIPGSDISSKSSSPVSEKGGQRTRNAKNARAEKKEQSSPSSTSTPWRRDDSKASTPTPLESLEKGSTAKPPRTDKADVPVLANGQPKEIDSRQDDSSVTQSSVEPSEATTPVPATSLSATPVPETPVSVTPAPVSPAPVSPDPATLASATQVPASSTASPSKVVKKLQQPKPSVPEFDPEHYPANQVVERKSVRISDIGKIHNRLSLQAAGDVSVQQAFKEEAATLKTRASKAGKTGSTSSKRSSLTHSTVATIFPSSVEQAARNRGSMSFMVDSEIDNQPKHSVVPEVQASQTATPSWADNPTTLPQLDSTSDEQDSSVRDTKKAWDNTVTSERATGGNESQADESSIDHGVHSYGQGETLPATMPTQSVAMGQGMYVISSSTAGAVNALPQPMWNAGPESNQAGSIAPPGSVVMAAPGGGAGHPAYQVVMPYFPPQGFPVNSAPYFYMYPRGPMTQMAPFPAPGVIPHQARMSADAALNMSRRDTLSGAVTNGSGISVGPSSDEMNSAMPHTGGANIGNNGGNNALTDHSKMDSILGSHPWLPRFSAAGDAPVKQQLQVSGSFLAPGPQANLMAAANVNRPPQSRPYAHHHAHHAHPHHAQRPFHPHQHQHGMDGLSAAVAPPPSFQEGTDSPTVDAWGNGVSGNNRGSPIIAAAATAANTWGGRGGNATAGVTGSINNVKPGGEAASSSPRSGMFGPYPNHSQVGFGPPHHQHPGGGGGGSHRGARGGFHGNNANSSGGYHHREIRTHHGRGGHNGPQFHPPHQQQQHHYQQQQQQQQNPQHFSGSGNNGRGGSVGSEGAEGKSLAANTFSPFASRTAASSSKGSATVSGESSA